MKQEFGLAPGMAADRPSIRDLVSYRLSRAASLISRGAAMRYRREFDVSLGEWRALALLAAGTPPSLMQLARAAGLDKAQMSRVVSSLVGRDLVAREGSGRSACLTLTAAGRSLYAALIAAAGERDSAFRAVLSPEELAVLETVLAKLVAQARQFIEAEAQAGGS
jgi:DNA-binding MarR family transcriptional regulator